MYLIIENMSPNKVFKKLNVVLFSGVSFFLACQTPVLYAQVSSQDIPENSVYTPAPIFIFSGGLLLIVVCIVLVLYFNRAQGQQADEKARFEFQRLSFAAVVLTGLGLIFLESMAMYYWAPPNSEAGKAIFETCKTVIPPIITLVLGYYFGKSDQVQASPNKMDKSGEYGEYGVTTNESVGLNMEDRP
ncbi:MAG: hypothetical protein AAF152_00765 [Cyanobacteria bacterium P01_A01_bin.114]